VEKNPEIKKQEIQKSIEYYQKALLISPGALDPVVNLGVAYFNLQDYDLAEKYWNEVKAKNSNYDFKQYDYDLSNAFVEKGLAISAEKKYDNCIIYFKKAIRLNPGNVNAWYNLGGVYYTIAQYDSANIAWTRTLQINPDYEQAKQGMNALAEQKK
jgi:tetratricopeptide (TPR) repeat protein